MEWSNKIGVFTKTQGTKQQAIQKTPLVFMIYLPLIKSGPGGNRTFFTYQLEINKLSLSPKDSPMQSPMILHI